MRNLARSHCRAFIVQSLVICLIALNSAGAQATNYDNPLRIGGQSRLHVGLEPLGAKATDAGLTREYILDHVAFRLFQSGIHFDPRAQRQPLSPTLYVNFNVIDGAASIRLDFSRWVSFEVDGVKHLTSATVWRAGLVARLAAPITRSDGDYLMDALDLLLADFIRDYLRDN